MRRTLSASAATICLLAVSSAIGAVPPASPWEMAVATERWMVDGAGARFPDGMADPARDGDSLAFVDETWPLAFRTRIGESIALRISPDTGCYEFEDSDGTVFWSVVPYAPLTWNWISPFRSPLRPDAQNLYSPFRLAREWTLTTPEIEAMRTIPMRRSPPRSSPPDPVADLRFMGFVFTETNLFFTAAWPTNETLPDSTLDLYGSTNLLNPRWMFISSHVATNPPVEFAVDPATLPWFVAITQHVHDATCSAETNIVLSPLDGRTVYTNIVWSCTTNRVPVDAGFFRLGTRRDVDGDGLFDAFELLVTGTSMNAVDTDLDGLSDAEELSFGTDPLLADTDGDGLPDSSEVSWIAVDTNGPARWIDTAALTNRTVLWTEFDRESALLDAPIPFQLFGHSLSNLSVNANGVVRWSVARRSLGAGGDVDGDLGVIPTVTGPFVSVAGFWDDLYASSSMTSSVSVAVSETNGIRTSVVEFLRAGFKDGGDSDLVSFQIQFSSAESNTVHVVFSEAAGLGTGESATLGYRASHGVSSVYSHDEGESVFPGLVLTYRIGLETDPLSFDSDADGLSDSEDLSLGTDPLDPDSDGDGLSDGEEAVLGTDPLDRDTDDDGLRDGDEIVAGTDPFDPDSDDDLLSDKWEVSNGTDPLDGLDALMDGDGDGLTLAQEVATYRTDPQCWDTDADGLSDGEEVLLGTNPRNRDSDGDGLPDGLEVELGTGPLDTDSDDDGIFDGWEHDHAPFDPLDPTDGAADFDGDGVSNAAEIGQHDSDWMSADTDGDGISDVAEIAAGTSPILADTDGDGIPDPSESLLGTSATSADTDGDGCSDGWEVRHGFDPLSSSSPVLSADPDDDGLSNLDEADRGTNPFSADTDGDGLSDGTEVSLGTDPLRADTDGDGLPDGAEVQRGLDPLAWDTDGDGLSDGEEDDAGTDPAVPNTGDDAAGADPDGDGLTNGQESALGTDWNDPDTDGDGVSDGAEFRQGSDPLDPADFEPRDGIDVVLTFGDDSGSHSEKYETTIAPASGDARPPFRLVNRQFGVPDEFTFRLATNAFYDVTLRHVDSNRERPDLDYTLSIAPSNALSGMAPLVFDPGGLLGKHFDVYETQFANTARVALVHARILADRNRDGVIDEYDRSSRPLRMWINDDKDKGSIADGDSDVPGGGGPTASGNAKTKTVDGMSDLEDFFPVWLDIAEALDFLEAVRPSARIGARLRCDSAEIGVVPTSLTRDHAGDYLRNVSTAESLASATSFRVGSRDAGMFPAVLSQMIQNPDKGVFLLEGSTQGLNAAFHVDLLADGDPVLRVTLPLSISPVEDFYDWINLRHVVDSSSEHRATDLSTPKNLPVEQTNGWNVVFVHGFNVTEREARGWHAEMFKRLWQSGSRAAYHAVTWRGDVGFPNGMYYHSDANNAFLTAPHLAVYVSGLPGGTTLMAHSLGNMVASSAIQDWNLSVDDYFMLNAAVPAESYDESQWNTNAVSNRMLHPEWESYAPRTWSAAWFTNFHDPDDSRSSLFWKGRFKDVFSRTTLYNFHSGTETSLGDQVLEVSEDRPDMTDALHYSFPWTLEARHLAWQKQELGKGRLSAFNWHFAGTTWAGWGHATKLVWHDLPSGNGGGYASEDITAAEANAMTEAQIRATPAFRRNPDKMLSSSIAYSDQCEILTYGIPALSGPAGTRVLHFSDVPGIDASRNIDMDTCRSNRQEWGRTGGFFGTRWLHSDLKFMAVPYVFPLFEQFNMNGSLR